MQSILVKIASVAVMFHMAFGCSWHHGLGPHACAKQWANTVCNHNDEPESNDCCHAEQGRDGHEHDHKNQPDSTSTITDDSESGGHSHLICHDDSCKVTKFVKFVFTPLDFSTQYLGGAESSGLVCSPNLYGFYVELIPDCSRTKTSVRAHLMLGVQIL